MKHPFYDHDTAQALDLGRNLIYGPFPRPNDPMPSAADALTAIESACKHAGFNWITGRVASQVLRAELGEPNPFTS